MWPANALTDRLKLKFPIIQAPMGSFSTPALAAAVSNAGALGGLGMWGLSVDDARRRIEGFRQQSAGSLNVNYPLWPQPHTASDVSEPIRRFLQGLYDEKALGPVPQPQGTASDLGAEHLAMLLDTRPEIVSFHFGLPEPAVIGKLRTAGIFIISSATTVAEARVLEQRGVHAIIAQGTEAGGHRATFSGAEMSMQAGLFALLPQVVDAVSVPVIAAGGVADGRQVAAALMLGASAVQMGTAFLRCSEANVHQAYRDALAAADESSTVVTELITGRPARYVRNRLVDDLAQSGLKALPIPAQLSLTAPLAATGDRELMPLFSGQSAALAKHASAAELIEALAAETTTRLRAFVRQ